MNPSPDPAGYLSACDVVDFNDPAVAALALELVADNDTEAARRCFTFVRDEIRHSSDCKVNPVTCRASDVLREKHGYCYAKSHLLVALLRANRIPAGFCYQRIAIDGKSAPFCLHGLVAAYLPDVGWYRMDARGNRDEIDAQFEPPTERLAFPIVCDGEYDLPDIFVSPLPNVVKCLLEHHDWADVYASLPDIDSMS